MNTTKEIKAGAFDQFLEKTIEIKVRYLLAAIIFVYLAMKLKTE